MDAPDDRSRRAEARGTWAGSLVRLEDTPEVELLSLPPDRLIALVTELTRLAWAIRQEPLPDYERARAPGRVVRPGGGA